MITLLRRAGLTAILTVLALPLAAPAYAHVTATPDEADSAFFRTSLRVGHGCDGSPTIAVRVRVPEGVESVRPEVVPGWEVELVTGDGEATEGDGADEGHDAAAPPVTEIAWTGGSLPDGYFQEFGLTFRITEQAPEVLYLPTVQECEEGEHAWIEIPDTLEEWDDLEQPAPYVINNADGSGHGAEPADDPAADAADSSEAGEGADAAAAGDAGSGAAGSDGDGPLPALALVAGLLGLVAGLAALWLNVRGRAAAERG